MDSAENTKKLNNIWILLQRLSGLDFLTTYHALVEVESKYMQLSIKR